MTNGFGAGWSRWAWLLPLLFWAACVPAEVPVPTLAGEVNDLTGTLSADQKAELTGIVRAFTTRKGTQLAVLVVPTTAPEPIEQYALRVAEQWKIGRKGIDDGALLVIAKDDRALRIEVGYGLEGVLSDAVSRRIIDEAILPQFRAGDFYDGIKAGVQQMIRLVDGEALPAPAAREPIGSGGFGQYAPILFILALGLGGRLRRALGRLPGALVGGGVVGAIAWFMAGSLVVALVAGVIAAFVSLLGLGMGGSGAPGAYYGGGRGRGVGMGGSGFPSGGSFGSGSGGFSGAGGGFGGGGASGRW